MKYLLFISPLFAILETSAQQPKANFYAVDRYAETVSASTPDSLAFRLTNKFGTDLEKVRAIFTWITQNIAYNTGIYASLKNYSRKSRFDPLDTMTIWKSGEEMAAIRVLHRRVTICEGYAKLFKVLCDYAGIKSELVVGYANGGRGIAKFRCNHTWNVVMVDGVWHPIDVTWASGYIDHRNEFVQRTDENYFLPSPKNFINDHYPEELRWALMDDVPATREFQSSPFRYKCFDKYSFTSVPKKGVIEAYEGDTIRVQVDVSDAARDKKISPNPFFDSTLIQQSPRSVFLSPAAEENKMSYEYVVKDPSIEWLHLFYNGDLVLRLHLAIKKQKQ